MNEAVEVSNKRPIAAVADELGVTARELAQVKVQRDGVAADLEALTDRYRELVKKVADLRDELLEAAEV